MRIRLHEVQCLVLRTEREVMRLHVRLRNVLTVLVERIVVVDLFVELANGRLTKLVLVFVLIIPIRAKTLLHEIFRFILVRLKLLQGAICVLIAVLVIHVLLDQATLPRAIQVLGFPNKI